LGSQERRSFLSRESTAAAADEDARAEAGAESETDASRDSTAAAADEDARAEAGAESETDASREAADAVYANFRRRSILS
jgi:hypothetical protein